MMRSLWICQDRHGGPADPAGHHLQQPRQRRHQRLQARPRRVRGPDVPEPAPGRRARPRADAAADRPAGRHSACAPVATARIFTQGNLQQTGNPLDVAINGNGFFQIQMPDGTTAYTRDGSFQVDAQGQLVTTSGFTVQPGITIPAERAERHHRPRRHGVGRRCRASAAAVQSASCSSPASSTRPACEPKGENLYAETALGHAERRHAGRERPGHAEAGLRRDLERQRRRGAGPDDPDAARLRDQLEGDPDLRPDAADAGAAVNDPGFAHCVCSPSPAGGATWTSSCCAVSGCCRRRAAVGMPRAVPRARRSRQPMTARSEPVPRPVTSNGAIFQPAAATGRCSRTTARASSATPSRRRSSRRSRQQELGDQRDRKGSKLGAFSRACPRLLGELAQPGAGRQQSGSNTFDGKGGANANNTFTGTITVDGDRRAAATATCWSPARSRSASTRHVEFCASPAWSTRAPSRAATPCLDADRRRAHRIPRPRAQRRGAGNGLAAALLPERLPF